MKKEEFLAKHTFSEEGFPIAKRVYETLGQDSNHTAMRTAKALGLLIQALQEKRQLTAEQVDTILMEVI